MLIQGQEVLIYDVCAHWEIDKYIYLHDGLNKSWYHGGLDKKQLEIKSLFSLAYSFLCKQLLFRWK